MISEKSWFILYLNKVVYEQLIRLTELGNSDADRSQFNRYVNYFAFYAKNNVLVRESINVLVSKDDKLKKLMDSSKELKLALQTSDKQGSGLLGGFSLFGSKTTSNSSSQVPSQVSSINSSPTGSMRSFGKNQQ